MKFVNFHRKPISMFVMTTFMILLCFWANQSPAAAMAPSSEKGSAATLEKSDSESSGFIEQEESEPVVKKGHKIPWLIIGAVVVIGAAAVYFLVLKPKYSLTVTLSGATGTPAATAKYKKNAAVAYNYTAQSGYVNLEVKLDGVVVPAAGTVTMDKDHSLTATAVQGSAISVSSNPAGAKIYLNNADSGFLTPHTFQYAAAVTKTVMLRQCGYKDYTKTVTAALGQTATVDTTLVQGIHEDFSVPASSCWAPRVPGNWTVSGGAYKMNTNVAQRDFSCYNFAFPDHFTLAVKFRIIKGRTANAIAVTLADSGDPTSFSGYAFQIIPGSHDYSVWKYQTKNYVTGVSVNSDPIKDWTGHSNVRGLNEWNTMKIVRAGSNYALYLGNVLIYSFMDSAYNARYVCLNAFIDETVTEIQYDYVYLDAGGAVATIPAQPAQAVPAAKGSDNHR